MLTASYPQDSAGRVKFEKIVTKIYNGGLNDIKTIKTIHDFIMNDKEASALMKCVLQKQD